MIKIQSSGRPTKKPNVPQIGDKTEPEFLASEAALNLDPTVVKLLSEVQKMFVAAYQANPSEWQQEVEKLTEELYSKLDEVSLSYLEAAGYLNGESKE